MILWVLGEFGAQADIGAAGVMEKVAAVAERQSLSDTARGYMLTTIAKLCAQVGLLSSSCTLHLMYPHFCNDTPHAALHVSVFPTSRAPPPSTAA